MSKPEPLTHDVIVVNAARAGCVVVAHCLNLLNNEPQVQLIQANHR
jgi:hypothetical protein